MKIRGGMLMVLLAAGAWVVLGAVNLQWAELNQDEGWYLYAAGEVARGGVPYVDFAYTQGPVMAWVYALISPVIDAGGVAAGRFFTLLLGGAGLILASRLAGRAVPAGFGGAAAVMTFVLLAVNMYHSQFTTIVKTYALTNLLIAGGLLLFARASGGRRPVAGVLAGLLLAAAACTRLSAGVLLPVVVLCGLLSRSLRPSRAWLAVAVGGAAGLGMILGPFFSMAPESIWFHLVQFHGGRSAGSGAAILLYKAGFLSRFVLGYFVLSACVIAVLLVHLADRSRGRGGREPAIDASLRRTVWIGFFALSLVHFSAPFPYDDYQVIAAPLLAIAVASAIVARMARPGDEETGPPAAPTRLTPLAWFLFFAAVLAAGSSPINQDLFIAERDRIWWRTRPASPLAVLRAAADQVRAVSKDGDLLLTQDLYLAVEAGRRVPAGLEMGPFSYYPQWSDERAARRRVVNRAGLRRLVESTDAPVAAVSGYGFAIAAPAIEPVPEVEREELLALLESRYALMATVGRFGQAGTELRIYGRKVSGEDAGRQD